MASRMPSYKVKHNDKGSAVVNQYDEVVKELSGVGSGTALDLVAEVLNIRSVLCYSQMMPIIANLVESHSKLTNGVEDCLEFRFDGAVVKVHMLKGK